MEYYTGIECFGYSADINPARHDIPPAHLVRVSHESKTGSGTIDLWVDRFDIQLLLEDPSALWDAPIDESPYAQKKSGSCLSQENAAFDAMLDLERYRDLFVPPCSSPHRDIAQAQLVIPGPTSSSRLRHLGVPTAAEYSANDRPVTVSHPERQQKTCAASNSSTPVSARRPKSIFKPEVAGLSTSAMDAFMREVKNRQTSTGLPVAAFWPATLEAHLSIELTATLINNLGLQAETELSKVVSTLRDEDRLALGFLSKWHSLHPYYRLIRDSRYVHADYHYHSLPVELRRLFPKTPPATLAREDCTLSELKPDPTITSSSGLSSPGWLRSLETADVFPVTRRILRELGSRAAQDPHIVQRCLTLIDEAAPELSFLNFTHQEMALLRAILCNIGENPSDASTSKQTFPADTPLHSSTQNLLRILLPSCTQ